MMWSAHNEGLSKGFVAEDWSWETECAVTGHLEGNNTDASVWGSNNATKTKWFSDDFQSVFTFKSVQVEKEFLFLIFFYKYIYIALRLLDSCVLNGQSLAAGGLNVFPSVQSRANCTPSTWLGDSSSSLKHVWQQKFSNNIQKSWFVHLNNYISVNLPAAMMHYAKSLNIKKNSSKIKESHGCS